MTSDRAEAAAPTPPNGADGVHARHPHHFAVVVVVAGVLAAACGAIRAEDHVIDATLEADGRTLQLGVDTCNASGHRVAVREDDAVVEVRVHRYGRSRGRPEEGEVVSSCMDGTTVELAAPLGDRALVDGTTGEPVTVLGR